MKSAVYMNGNRFIETAFIFEKDLEQTVRNNSKTLFGEKTIFLILRAR